MSSTPARSSPTRPRGRARFAALGYGIRAVKALPAPIRERVLDRVVDAVGENPPPLPDVLRLLRAADGAPDGTRWQGRLSRDRPTLAAVRTREFSLGPQGAVRARLYSPATGAAAIPAAFVWVHGGAFVVGSLDQKEAHWPAIELAAAGIAVLSVDYRKCYGGIHYPTPLDDVLDAWHWAVEHADALGVSSADLHLGGASAGGCLAVGAILRLRDAGEPLPASLYLAYPQLEGRLPPAQPYMVEALARTQEVPEQWLTDEFANWAGEASWDDPYVSPALADPVGMPATYVLTCGRDSLRRSSEPYVARLRDAGIPLWHDVFADSEHAVLNRPGTPDGDRAVRRLRAWLTGGVAAMAE